MLLFVYKDGQEEIMNILAFQQFQVAVQMVSRKPPFFFG
jgi:hypothetical protein